MKKEIIIGMAFTSLMLLVGCSSSPSSFDIMKNRYETCKLALEDETQDYLDCQSEISDWKFNGIKEEDLHTEATDNCVLIVIEDNVNWEEPSHYSYKKVVPLRTLTLETDQINPPDYDDFKYWLACDTTYR